MKYKNISALVFIGAFAIIILQLLWLYNTYVALENNLYKESNTILIKAIRRESQQSGKQTTPKTNYSPATKNPQNPKILAK